MKVSISYLFDSRRNPEGVYTLQWYLYYNGKQKPFSTGFKLSTEDVEFLKETKSKGGIDGRLRDEHKRNLWNMLYGQTYSNFGVVEDSLMVKAEKIIDSIEVFSFDAFKERLKNPDAVQKKVEAENFPDDLIECLKFQATELKANGQIGNANSHTDASQSMLRFLKYSNLPPKLTYQNITPDFLDSYEKWMLKEGKAPRAKRNEKNIRDQERNPDKYQPKPASEATLGIYCRYFRKMTKLAIKRGYLKEDDFPFGSDKFVIPEVENAARSLESDDIQKFIAYEPEAPLDQYYHDLWILSYLSNGINATDIANLKWSDYDKRNASIRFFREKTKRTTRKKKVQIQISVFQEVADIIEKWGVNQGSPDAYIFPILQPGLTAERQKALITQHLKNANKALARISVATEMPFPVKTNDARDSQATVLMQAGAPLPFIQKAMGHKKLETTMRYFGRFSDPKTKSILAALLPKEE